MAFVLVSSVNHFGEDVILFWKDSLGFHSLKTSLGLICNLVLCVTLCMCLPVSREAGNAKIKTNIYA